MTNQYRDRTIELLRQYSLIPDRASPKARRIEAQIAALNDRLALKEARKMQRACTEDFEDLAQLARIGLLKAIQRFQLARNVAFSSFAVPYIRGEIKHYLRDHWGLLKVPRRWLETYESVDLVHRILIAKGRQLSKLEIAIALGENPARWTEIEHSIESRLVAQLDEHHDPETPADDRQGLRELAVGKVALLPTLQRRCVTAYLLEGKSEAAIAQALKVDAALVRAHLEKALAKLKEAA